MPAVLIGALTWFLSNAFARILLGAGISVITITWLDGAINSFLTDSAALMSSAASDVVGLVGLGGVWVAMSTIGSALLMRTAIIAASNIMGFKKS
jgi:uncharacterized protein DUF2523